MKFQIIVKSCWRDKEYGYHDVIRKTWGGDFKSRNIPVRFAMGEAPPSPSPVEWDEMVFTDLNDDYDHLPHKTKAICQSFATLGGSEYIYLCDNDTFLIPERMTQINLVHDYVGRFTPGPVEIGATFHFQDARGFYHPLCRAWASGGVGYFLSRRAATLVAESVITSWAEDLWVGQVVGNVDDMTISQPPQFECWAAWHWRRSKRFNTRQYDSEWMYNMWADYQQGKI